MTISAPGVSRQSIAVDGEGVGNGKGLSDKRRSSIFGFTKFSWSRKGKSEDQSSHGQEIPNAISETCVAAEREKVGYPFETQPVPKTTNHAESLEGKKRVLAELNKISGGLICNEKTKTETRHSISDIRYLTIQKSVENPVRKSHSHSELEVQSCRNLKSVLRRDSSSSTPATIQSSSRMGRAPRQRVSFSSMVKVGHTHSGEMYNRQSTPSVQSGMVSKPTGRNWRDKLFEGKSKQWSLIGQ
eukprot:Nk52_evm38s1129 gene=Nk52_evmTU38s1129